MKNMIKHFVICAFLLTGVFVWSYSGNSVNAATETFQPQTIDAETLYKKNCAGCHGKDGRAKTFRGKIVRARNLTDADWQASVSDEHLSNAITNGQKKMPAFGKKLSAEEINSLIGFVRSLKK